MRGFLVQLNLPEGGIYTAVLAFYQNMYFRSWICGDECYSEDLEYGEWLL